MKPDYKNWMPKGMIWTGAAAAALLLTLWIVFGLSGFFSGTAKTVLFIAFLVLTIIALCVTGWMILEHLLVGEQLRRAETGAEA